MLPCDPRAEVRNLGAKYTVVSWTLLVTITCRLCDAKSEVTLINTQVAVCPSCGATHELGGMRWDVTTPTLQTPQFGIASALRALIATH